MCTASLLLAIAPVALTCDRGHLSFCPMENAVTVVPPDRFVHSLKVALHIAWIFNPLPAQGAVVHGFMPYVWRKGPRCQTGQSERAVLHLLEQCPRDWLSAGLRLQHVSLVGNPRWTSVSKLLRVMLGSLVGSGFLGDAGLPAPGLALSAAHEAWASAGRCWGGVCTSVSLTVRLACPLLLREHVAVTGTASAASGLPPVTGGGCGRMRIGGATCFAISSFPRIAVVAWVGAARDLCRHSAEEGHVR